MKSVKVIIARYNEPLDWLKNLKYDFVVYNKGDQIQESIIPADRVINVPNEGREAETYLRWITENHQNITDAVIFLQGNPFDHCSDLFSKIENLDLTQEFVSLGNETFCDLFGNESYPGLLIGEFRNVFLPGYSDSERIDFVAGVQFIVRGDLIKNKNLDWWINLKERYNEFWFSGIESGYLIPPGHFIAHVFERLWPSIFKYIPDGK